MAWLSIGTSNEDLCLKLQGHQILKSGRILQAFQATDRGDFVFPDDRAQAYFDRPYKRDYLHISAPHMYVSVLEALDLQEGQSFLNIGSGSGYLCCLAAYLVGERGLVQGIEVSDAAVQHSKSCCSAWRQQVLQPPHQLNLSNKNIEIVTGNAFDLDVAKQVLQGRFDRVYVGAACPLSLRDFFLALLRDNGILVAPIQEKNQLVQVRRVCGDVFSQTRLTAVHFAPLLPPVRPPVTAQQLQPAFYSHHRYGRMSTAGQEEWDDEEQDDYEEEMKEGDRDTEAVALKQVWSLPPASILVVPASVLPSKSQHSHQHQQQHHNHQRTSVVLPSQAWKADRHTHHRFPMDFRQAVYTLLMCVSFVRPSHRPTSSDMASATDSQQLTNSIRYNFKMGVAAHRVPVAVWLQVVSFMTRDWFVAPPNETQLLRAEIVAERRLRIAAESELQTIALQCRVLEKERDRLRSSLVQHQQQQSRTSRSNHHNNSNSATAAVHSPLHNSHYNNSHSNHTHHLHLHQSALQTYHSFFASDEQEPVEDSDSDSDSDFDSNPSDAESLDHSEEYLHSDSEQNFEEDSSSSNNSYEEDSALSHNDDHRYDSDDNDENGSTYIHEETSHYDGSDLGTAALAVGQDDGRSGIPYQSLQNDDSGSDSDSDSVHKHHNSTDNHHKHPQSHDHTTYNNQRNLVNDDNIVRATGNNHHAPCPPILSATKRGALTLALALQEQQPAPQPSAVPSEMLRGAPYPLLSDTTASQPIVSCMNQPIVIQFGTAENHHTVSHPFRSFRGDDDDCSHDSHHRLEYHHLNHHHYQQQHGNQSTDGSATMMSGRTAASASLDTAITDVSSISAFPYSSLPRLQQQLTASDYSQHSNRDFRVAANTRASLKRPRSGGDQCDHNQHDQNHQQEYINGRLGDGRTMMEEPVSVWTMRRSRGNTLGDLTDEDFDDAEEGMEDDEDTNLLMTMDD